MVASFISSQFVVEIKGVQIDLYFDLKNGLLEVFADNELISHAKFHPTYLTFSPSNILQLAELHYNRFIRISLELLKKEMFLD